MKRIGHWIALSVIKCLKESQENNKYYDYFEKININSLQYKYIIMMSSFTFQNFDEWVQSKSKSLQEQSICFFLTSLMQQLFGKSTGEIIINNESENDQNQQLIKDNWDFLEVHFNVPKRAKNTQKLVRQTFKYVFESVNSKYSFQKPLQFIPKDDRKRVNGQVTNVAYTILRF